MRISYTNFADLMGVSKRTLLLWEHSGKFVPETDDAGTKFFETEKLMDVPEIKEMQKYKAII